MRTTLAIDDDVLMAAKGLAARDKRSVGEVITELARKGLVPDSAPPVYRNGIMLLPVRPGAGHATLELVNRLRDEAP
jgi:hypothetical protein